MRCQFCNCTESKVMDSRPTEDGSIRRRRECIQCGRRFTTYEKIEMVPLMVVKRDGRRETFELEKAKAGILQLTKALSIEMRTFGVQCCCILPGDVKTGFTAARRIAAAAQDPASPYREMTVRSLAQMEKDEQREGMAPSVIASAVLRQLRRKKMRPECVPGALYAFLVPVIRLLPERLVLRVIGKMYL